MLEETRPDPGSSSIGFDDDLVRRLKAGDRNAYREAVTRYSPRMLGAARSIVGPDAAEDIVQESWVAVLTRLDGFEGRSALSTWLIRITTNRAISHLRATSRQVALGDTGDGEHAAPDAEWFDQRGRWVAAPAPWDAGTPEELLSAGALQACIDKHLALMPVNQRTVLVMRDLQQRPFGDICNELGISASNARVLLHRARLRLFDMINGYRKTGAC